MTGENALKACARRMLEEEYDADGLYLEAERVAKGLLGHQAIRAIEKALTRSPVCEDARELVEALRPFARATLGYERLDDNYTFACGGDQPITLGDLRRLAEIWRALDLEAALAKAPRAPQ